MRAKLYVGKVARLVDNQGKIYAEEIVMYAVSANTPENKTWAKHTPMASFNMTIDNPDCFGFYHLGDEIYVDLNQAIDRVAPVKAATAGDAG